MWLKSVHHECWLFSITTWKGNHLSCWSFLFHLHGLLKGEAGTEGGGAGALGKSTNHTSKSQWAALQANDTPFPSDELPTPSLEDIEKLGNEQLLGWGGGEASWQPEQSRQLVGENVPGEENWQRKERLEKARELRSEKAAHPSRRATTCFQMSPLCYSSTDSVLKRAHAWVSPGTLAKMQIQGLPWWPGD